jgi:hypothetical protein
VRPSFTAFHRANRLADTGQYMPSPSISLTLLLHFTLTRAEDWGLDKPMITGELKVIQKGDDCRVRLYDPGKTGPDGGPVLFAECPIVIDEAFKKKKLEFYVESVVDSSRYFVLRVEVTTDSTGIMLHSDSYYRITPFF